MCTVHETEKFRKPNTDKVIAYKVFDGNGLGEPRNYCGGTVFPIDKVIIWKTERAEDEGYGDQQGFQMFAYKKDALKYACGGDFICKIEIDTKNIRRVGEFDINTSSSSYQMVKAYEVRRFKITNKNWKQRISK